MKCKGLLSFAVSFSHESTEVSVTLTVFFFSKVTMHCPQPPFGWTTWPGKGRVGDPGLDPSGSSRQRRSLGVGDRQTEHAVVYRGDLSGNLDNPDSQTTSFSWPQDIERVQKVKRTYKAWCKTW